MRSLAGEYLKTAALVLISLSIGCGVPTVPDRVVSFSTNDPKALVGLKDLSLLLVLSKNSLKAVEYSEQRASWFASGNSNAGISGMALFEDIDGFLQQHFKSFRKTSSDEEAKDCQCDLIAILDVYTDYPSSVWSDVIIEIGLKFFTPEGQPIDEIHVKEKVEPHAGAGAVMNAMVAGKKLAISDLAIGLRNSQKLAGYGKSRTQLFATANRRQEASGYQPTVPSSDVDTVVASQVHSKQHAYAILVGIEQYREKLPKADFADRDAKLVGEYLTKVLGYPEENVIVRLNDKAAKTDLEKYFESWLPNNVDSSSTVFVYYSGHGTPSTKNGEAYLVPYDGDPTFIDKTCYPLKRLYEYLDKLPAKEVIVMLDSCFSGAGGRSVLAKGARPMALSVENPALASGKTIVLAASGGDQISNSFEEKGHGLLTYYFLKGLQGEADTDKDGAIGINELYNYVKPNVQRIARKQYNNEQTPQLLANPEVLRKGGVKLIELRTP